MLKLTESNVDRFTKEWNLCKIVEPQKIRIYRCTPNRWGSYKKLIGKEYKLFKGYSVGILTDNKVFAIQVERNKYMDKKLTFINMVDTILLDNPYQGELDLGGA